MSMLQHGRCGFNRRTPPECYDAHDVLMSALSHGRDGFSRQPIQELSTAYLQIVEPGVLAVVSYRIKVL